MTFIIKRTDQGGGLVARSGSEHSYTQNLLEARQFKTQAEAEANICPENEVVVDLWKLVRGSNGKRTRNSRGGPRSPQRPQGPWVLVGRQVQIRR